MIYDMVLITLQFFGPLLVLVYTYTRISIVVCKNRTLRHRMSQGTSPRLKSLRVMKIPNYNNTLCIHYKDKNLYYYGSSISCQSGFIILLFFLLYFQTVRMSLIVVLGYAIAWLPYNIVDLLYKYQAKLGESEHFPYIYIACHWLAMSHSVFNPIIYFWLNDSFRTTVLELFCRKKAIERRRTSSTHFSWRTSNLYTNGRSTSINRPSTCSRLKHLRSASESSSYPGSPLIKIPSKLEVGKALPDEETMIIIRNDGNE